MPPKPSGSPPRKRWRNGASPPECGFATIAVGHRAWKEMLPAPEEPSMTFVDRRAFFGLAGAAAVAGAVGPAVAAPPPSGIKSITGSAEPISAAERPARIARAQPPMRASGLSALLIEPGARLLFIHGGPRGPSGR